MKKIQSLKLNKIGELYFIIAFLSMTVVSAFVVEKDIHMPIPYSWFFIFIMAIVFASYILFYRKMPNIGIVPAVLALRAFIAFTNGFIIGDFTNSMLYELLTLSNVLVFICVKNYFFKNLDLVKDIFVAFVLITSLQLFLCILINGSDKGGIYAIVGASNYVASFLLLCCTYLIFIKTTLFEKIVVLLGLIALLATQSFGAYLAIVVVAIIFIIKSCNWKSKKTYIFLSIAILSLAIICIVFFNTSFGKSIFDKIITKFGYLFSGDLKSFSSSRTELYPFSWGNISRNIVFGTISNYNPAMSAEYRFQNFMTHNVILESLLRYGIVGTVINIAIFAFILYEGIKNLKKYKTPEYFACLIVIIAITIHGMIEPNYFTADFGRFFWLIAGVFVSPRECKKNSNDLKLCTKNFVSELK